MPQVSIIVPVRLATGTIQQTMGSLLAQAVDGSVEVIAAVGRDDPSAALLSAINHPSLRVIHVNGPSGVPQLRRDAVLVARFPYVIITEDHCIFPDGWVEKLVRALESRQIDVIGGGVTNGRLTWGGWAQYFTRYCAFLPPVANGETRHLPGNNACYRKSTVDEYKDFLRDGFWEAELNQRLLASGLRFAIDSSLTVTQHQQRGAFEYVPLRYRHGRCYGARRFAVATAAERRRLLLKGPLIPVILLWRAIRSVLGKPRYRAPFAAAFPLVALYITAWSVGELTGYVCGAGNSCEATD